MKTNELPCKFCRWVKEDLKELKEQGDLLLNAEDYFIIKADNPRTDGHALIITKKHYSDITAAVNINNFLIGLWAWTNVMKNMYDLEKVYVVSMCEHFTDEELTEWGVEEITEHLHFHLIPRYEGDKRGNAFLAGE
jgi:hypothetical protein